MKKRYVYALLFALPGLVAAFILTTGLFAVVLGFLWLYVFGDGPWPRFPDPAVGLVFSLVFLCFWLATAVGGYFTGRKLEQRPGGSGRAVLISISVTMVLVLLILLQQLTGGRLGPKPDSLACSGFCRSEGYTTSEMPPANTGERICYCLDRNGQRVMHINLDILSGN